jgi:hypothetical protein
MGDEIALNKYYAVVRTAIIIVRQYESIVCTRVPGELQQ